mgnify:CR=1 FL=1
MPVEACIRRAVEVGFKISLRRSCKRHVVEEILVRQHRPGRAGCVRKCRSAVEVAPEICIAEVCRSSVRDGALADIVAVGFKVWC